MNKIKRKLTALALSVVSAISFVGCSAFENIKKDLDDYFDAPCTHIDENVDNICDGCGATIATNDTDDTTDTPATDTETHVCASENESFYCSNCGNVIPAVVLDYYANDAVLETVSTVCNVSASTVIGNVYRRDYIQGSIFSLTYGEYTLTLFYYSDYGLSCSNGNVKSGIYTCVQGDFLYMYIPTDFVVQFVDLTTNEFVNVSFSECFISGYVFGWKAKQVVALVDVEFEENKTMLDYFANDESPYKTYAMDETDSPLLSGMSCLEMLGHVYKFPTVDGSIFLFGTFFTLKTADGVEIKLNFSLEKMWLYTDYGNVIDDSLLTNISRGANSVYILLSGDMVIPISETETVYLSECTLVSTPALICIPDVAIDSNNK